VFDARKGRGCRSGDVFGNSGTGFLRCSYAASRDDVKEALRSIEEFLASIRHVVQYNVV